VESGHPGGAPESLAKTRIFERTTIALRCYRTFGSIP
jgi:hypothetical protein